MPIYAEANKILALKSYAKNNIKIVNHGTDVTYSEQYARELEKKDKANVYISPYNDELVIAGQGTIACELVQQSPTPLDAVFVTVGGGGLVSGISIYLKNKWPDCKIIGCQPANSPVMVSLAPPKNKPVNNYLINKKNSLVGEHQKGLHSPRGRG